MDDYNTIMIIYSGVALGILINICIDLKRILWELKKQ